MRTFNDQSFLFFSLIFGDLLACSRLYRWCLFVHPGCDTILIVVLISRWLCMAKNQHGGKRVGAGRKRRFDEPVTRIRVPVSCVPAIDDLLAKLVQAGGSQCEGLEVLRPVDPAVALERPLFSSPVPAGFPSPADDYIEGQLDLNEYFVPHPASTFYVRVTGESMNGAGILPGDILVVDRSLEAVHGAVVIAVVNNELTVKRLYKQNGRIELHPANPDFSVMTFGQDMELVIWGVVSGVTRKL